jgi:hypothetical protein
MACDVSPVKADAHAAVCAGEALLLHGLEQENKELVRVLLVSLAKRAGIG